MIVTIVMAEIGNHAGNEPWPSLEWASWIFDRASFVLIGSLVFGAIATVAIVWMGIVKEHHWDTLRDESRLRVATLESETAKAKAELGKANAEIARAHEKTATVEKATAEAHERTASLAYQLEIERQKRAPRSLTDEQKEAMIAELKGKLERVTVAVQADLEARAFATQLHLVLSEAGVAIEPFNLPPGDVHTAFGLLMHRPGGANSEADLKDDPLYKALKRAKLYGGYAAKPFSRLSFDLTQPGPLPLIPLAGHVLYVGQKSPW